MALLDSFISIARRFAAPKDDEIKSITLIKSFYANKAMACRHDHTIYFLRQLNRADGLDEVWALRSEFYNLMSQCYGELEAMRHTDTVHEFFKPFIQRGRIKGASPGQQTSGPPSARHSGGPTSRK
jgi:hypothetical protein